MIISFGAPIGLYVTVHASYLIWRTRNKYQPKSDSAQTVPTNTNDAVDEIPGTSSDNNQSEDIEEQDETTE